ncbi:GTPase and tRNA-U34 5-formylation enzyme TrmE [Smithella sp. ME-1]|uniref:Gtpase and trna-u34 5-formylation enzyme trme n=1 Tax=hydrocarbon metagenome TaxID=938273 RepID=A0A0W8FT71_9ZZZZ|nr:GTPase and tRNA-U34 5-formylation enzyme TrmE [Smithella sp. ME-1]
MLCEDTIAAIATPFGLSGVGIIRISGPEALEIARRIFQPSNGICPWESHHLYHGDIVSADGKTILDEVLISSMRKPRSFTGEDVVEINCHGNPIVMHSILTQLHELGCRLARHGEFSQRAFLNNRLDLSQAEALSSMIAAPSAKAYAMGLSQLKGSLSREIEDLRLLLIEALALLETAIDFTEDTSEDKVPEIPPQINQALERTQSLLSSYNSARAYSEGINVIITGKPNVGKSSLLNSLIGRKKAIVTDIPGTTRDMITDTINIKGIPVHLIDTAGIREPQNLIEKEGISLVWESLANADIVIVMLDVSNPLTDEDRLIIDKNKSGKLIASINKIDLPRKWEADALKKLFPRETKFLEISAKLGNGLEELKSTIIDLSVSSNDEYAGSVMITSLRHKLATEKALKNIQNAKESIAQGMSAEFAAFDLREAIDNLDEITGNKINDEILDKIFSSFCIGK